MKKVFFLITLFLLVAGCTTSEPVQIETPLPTTEPPSPTDTSVPPTRGPQPSDKGKLEKGQITSQALADNLIGDPATRDYWVYLPPSYSTSDKLFPVVYALHGYMGDENELITMTPDLNTAITSGEAHEMIFVFLDGDNKFRGSWYRSSPTIGDYESYVVNELVAHIDANYRTISDPDSRGITGCSMGGDGSLRLALNHPDVFSVVASMSGTYDFANDPAWDKAKQSFLQAPENFDDFDRLPWEIQYLIAGAAAASSNPDKPPFYLDMPFEVIDGKGQIVPNVWEKINDVDPVDDIRDYLNQSVRLRGLMIYHGEYDAINPIGLARDFDKLLTELEIEHEYVEVGSQHCRLDYLPLLQFLSDHLDH